MVMSRVLPEQGFPFNRDPLADITAQVAGQKTACCARIGGIDLDPVNAVLGLEMLIPGDADRAVQLQDISGLGHIALAYIVIVRRTRKNAERQRPLEGKAARVLQIDARGTRRKRASEDGGARN